MQLSMKLPLLLVLLALFTGVISRGVSSPRISFKMFECKVMLSLESNVRLFIKVIFQSSQTQPLKVLPRNWHFSELNFNLIQIKTKKITAYYQRLSIHNMCTDSLCYYLGQDQPIEVMFVTLYFPLMKNNHLISNY